ncbi:MAG: hypothetical protein K5846_06375 [Bacteroidales bacterium]|nr:hypothetical protein [Bacteroidales bacterium]
MRKVLFSFFLCLMGMVMWAQSSMRPQCDIMLAIGASSALDKVENPVWLEVYADDAEEPFYRFYRDKGNVYSETVHLSVTEGMTLRFVWHEPDKAHHSSWFIIFDPDANVLFEKVKNKKIKDGVVLTYTAQCGAN